MTVKEVFDLRKQGKIEEAYEAIRPMYAAHKGRYTTLCMFWTAADVFKLRLEQKQYDEAAKILEALKRMLHRVEEITKQLDSERPTATPTDKPAENKRPLPWEKGETKAADEQNKAAAFIASATRRLEKAQKGRRSKKAIDMGNFYAVPADNRDLNYDKYFKEGDVKRATIEEFNSDNTRRLNLEETKAKIASLEYIQNELNGIPNIVK